MLSEHVLPLANSPYFIFNFLLFEDKEIDNFPIYLIISHSHCILLFLILVQNILVILLLSCNSLSVYFHKVCVFVCVCVYSVRDQTLGLLHAGLVNFESGSHYRVQAILKLLEFMSYF